MTTGHYIYQVRKKIYKEDILKAGTELMFLNGYNATGIKEITNKVNIPKGSFYNHFSSKEAFGLEVVKLYTERGIGLHKKALLESNISSPIERLVFMYKRITNNYRDTMNSKLGCIMGNFSAELGDTNENFRTLLDSQFDEIQKIISQCLEEAKNKNEISKENDINLLSDFILNSWHGALIRMKSTANTKPLENFTSFLEQYLTTK